MAAHNSFASAERNGAVYARRRTDAEKNSKKTLAM
jgi:hypothetical protein